jgi:hypothetical protein
VVYKPPHLKGGVVGVIYNSDPESDFGAIFVALRDKLDFFQKFENISAL